MKNNEKVYKSRVVENYEKNLGTLSYTLGSSLGFACLDSLAAVSLVESRAALGADSLLFIAFEKLYEDNLSRPRGTLRREL